MEEKYPCPKMTPKQWIVNFWYYNKWFVLLGLVVLSLIVISTVQFFKKSEPDVAILYAGPVMVSDDVCTKMSESCGDLISDVNGDGKVSVSLKSYVLNANVDILDSNEEAFKNGYSVQLLDGQVEGRKIQGNEEFKSYNDELLYGESFVLLLDQALYEELAKNGLLVNLKEITGSELPENAVGEYGLRLVDTRLFGQEGFDSLPFDTVVCLRYPSAIEGKKADNYDEQYKENLEVFRQIID